MLAKRLRPFTFALLSVMVLVYYVARAAPATGSEQVSALLQDVKTQAALLSYDAATFRLSYNGSPTQGYTTGQMQARIRETHRLLARLQEQRNFASPWQATAMDRLDPLLRELAANTETVIQHLDENPKRIFLEEFSNQMEATAKEASRLSALIRDLVDHPNTAQGPQPLTSKLERNK
jgi:hypothetical protein